MLDDLLFANGNINVNAIRALNVSLHPAARLCAESVHGRVKVRVSLAANGKHIINTMNYWNYFPILLHNAFRKKNVLMLLAIDIYTWEKRWVERWLNGENEKKTTQMEKKRQKHIHSYYNNRDNSSRGVSFI